MKPNDKEAQTAGAAPADVQQDGGGAAEQRPVAVAIDAPGKPRSEVVTLTWPVQFDGQTYTKITVKRLSTAEVAEFARQIAAGEGERVRLPMFDVPPEVIDAIDPDDDDRLEEVVTRFLPRRLREVAAQAQAPGADTSQSSPQLSGGAAKT